MTLSDTGCSIVPYFQIHQGKEAAFRELCQRFINRTQEEEKCLYYGFSFSGDKAHCREAYTDAEGVLFHLDNVAALLEESLQIADLIQLEIHGPETELEKLREPLAKLNPEFFVLEGGFRN